MITFKCKMCGGELEFEQGATVAECPFCGTQQTLPKLDDDRRANLYDRANHFRRQNEYDKAMALFEKILQEDRTDAEAYWSLVLCRYGIEYVVDPASGKRVPTVNRVQYTSVLADEDYKSALQYADSVQREVYKQEAAVIDEIQKGILAISRKEKPFDVFICYKETDANGRRTPDSVLANDLYHQLTNEGFKVFFSRITLEDKIGSAYEPYIFAALNSAKVMVVLGTKPEYFNAVWVKNEWSRFLALIKSGAEKTLVPAYRDMDPYDLPEEFSHLQAQDMSKLGFMQDLIRGIKKLTQKDEPAPAPTVQVVQAAPVQAAGNATVESLMRRAELFMEDADFNSANEYLDKVLDIDPEYAPAYLGKVQSSLKLRKADELSTVLDKFERFGDWQKAIRFATPEQRQQYQKYLSDSENARDTNRKENIYRQASQKLNSVHSTTEIPVCLEAEKLFASISGFKDATAKAERCRETVKLVTYEAAATALKRARTVEECEAASRQFEKAKPYKDSVEQIQACQKKAYEIQKTAYDTAVETLRSAQTPEKCDLAADEFHALPRFLDSAEKEKEARAKAEQLQKEWEEKKEQERKIAERNAKEAKRKQWKKRLILSVSVLFISIAIVIFSTVIKPSNDYKRAQQAFASGDYADAANIWNGLGDYKDSHIMRQESLYQQGIQYIEKGEYGEAASIFDQIINYRDSEMQFQNAKLTVGKEFLEQGDRVAALLELRDAGFNAEAMRLANKIQSAMILSFSGHIVGLKNDGTVIAIDEETAYDSRYDVSGGPCDVSTWSDIVGLAGAEYCTIGLKKDGSVVATGDCIDQITDLSNVETIAVCDEPMYFMVLMKDGTVSDAIIPEEWQFLVDAEEYQFLVNEWSNIIDISVGYRHVVGLKADGTVVATGDNEYGQCDVEDWMDIVSVCACRYGTVGLKADGTLIVAGDPSSYEWDADDVADWSDIVSISVPSTGDYIVGLKADGTVVKRGDSDFTSGLSDWSDIVMIEAGNEYCVAVRASGKVETIEKRSRYNIMGLTRSWDLW